jgi:uncharacterized protein (TIGR02186 family)
MPARAWLLTVALTVVDLASAGAAAPPAAAGPAAPLAVHPADVPVGVFHNGTRLDVEATVPSSDEVAIVCAGHDGEVKLTTKGKALGLLWINTGEVTLDHVPALYEVNTEHTLCELARPAVRQDLGVGYDTVEARIASDRDESEELRVFHEFVKLKEREGLYAEREDSVQRADLGDGLARVSTTFWLPARTPFGSYQVALYGFKDGVGSKLGSVAVTVRPVGLVAFMSSLATHHGLLFGLLAVGVAIAMGLLTGVVFGRGSSKGH